MNKHLSLLIVIIVALTACSKRIPTYTSKSKNVYNIKNFHFDYLSLKSKMVVDYPNKPGVQNATANVRVKKDSIIWFNLTGNLGIQGLRGIFTKDSVKILNRVTKEYIRFTYEEFSHEFNFRVDYNTLQALLLGNLINLSEGEVQRNDGQYIVKQEVNDIDIMNHVDESMDKITNVNMMERSTDNVLKIEYSNFQDIYGQMFAYSGFVSVKYKDRTGSLESKVNIEHSKVDISDKPLRFPFNVPNKYIRKYE